MLFRQLYDAESSTYTYLLADEKTREAVLIDPVIEQVERDATLIEELGLKLLYALDTHVHADHVTATGALRDRLGCKTVVSDQAGVDCADVRVKDGETVSFGSHQLEVRETPGHTRGCVSYVMSDKTIAFTGDTLLIRGCGRTDFQGGDAHELYRSVHSKLFTLPPMTTVYPAHDYKGRTATSIGEEQRLNQRLGAGRTEDEFVQTMATLQLAYPKKIDVALPLNLQCGKTVPAAEPSASQAEPRAKQAADPNAVQAADPKAVQAADPTAVQAPPLAVAAGGFVLSTTGVPEVAPAWVAAHASEVRIIDVREPAEFSDELGHIEGAELVPLAKLSTAAHADYARPIVTVCRSGGRSAKAVEILNKLGLQRVASMQGGMAAWSQAKLPVKR